MTFERTDGGAPPDFGPAHVAGPARNQATVADGLVDVRLARGAYRVTASRGPEYDIAQADVVLAAGDERSLDLSPRRVVDTSGYLGCDFHQHTMLGADAPVGMVDRVVSNAAEGVQVADASEHNVVADLEPIVRELHLERDLVSIPGDELTSDASRHPWGHANAFPLTFDASRPRGGAPIVRDRTAREVFDEVRASSGGAVVIQVNHPRAGHNGYSTSGSPSPDPATGVGTAPGYDARFDALEGVERSQHVDARSKVLGGFFALLRTRHLGHGHRRHRHARDRRAGGRVPADVRSRGERRAARVVGRCAVSRHRAWREGAPRRRADERPHAARHRERRPGRGSRARAGRSSEGARRERAVGGRRRAARGAGVGRPGGSGPGDAHKVVEKPNARGALAADAELVVRVGSDDAIVVMATGSKTMTPVLGAGLDPAETTPWAMTGAIWIDADGDGGALGR